MHFCVGQGGSVAGEGSEDEWKAGEVRDIVRALPAIQAYLLWVQVA